MSIRTEMETSRIQGRNERKRQAEKYAKIKMRRIKKKLVANSRYGKEQCAIMVRNKYAKTVDRFVQEESLLMVSSDILPRFFGYERWIVFKNPVVWQRIDNADVIEVVTR